MTYSSTEQQQTTFSADLAGVIVGETAISNVDGQRGRLSYRGVAIETVIAWPFPEVVWLLITGQRPGDRQQQLLADFMAAHSGLTLAETALLERLPRALHPMLMLQGMVPLIDININTRVADALLSDSALTVDALQGLVIAAKLPALIAAWYRLQHGLVVVPSLNTVSFHENFLTIFHGRAPTQQQIQLLDAVQILQLEHSFNASTFAGRVCASTLAPIQSCISASIGTLFGVLHGGADQAALEMALAIADPGQARDYVTQCLSDNIKIMGMGHREYKTVDPRATLLKPMALALSENSDSKMLLDILVNVEQACRQAFAQQGKDIWANVEFYKGAVFHALGIPPQYFTALFAMARVYGYIAHFIEFKTHSRLIRPRARYVGK